MLKQDKVSEFTRGLLSPLLKEYKCGLIIVHHTNKTNNAASAGAAYAGAGSAEWANWARAIILLMPKDGRFKLILAKRGARAGWKKADGKTLLLERELGQSKEEGKLYWRQIELPELPDLEKVNKVKGNAELLLSLVSHEEPISAQELIKRAKVKEIGEQTAKSLIKSLLKDKLLVRTSRPRSRTRPEIFYHRAPNQAALEAEIDMIDMNDIDDPGNRDENDDGLLSI